MCDFILFYNHEYIQTVGLNIVVYETSDCVTSLDFLGLYKNQNRAKMLLVCF